MRYGRLVVHGLLILYALILAYVIGGLIFKYTVPVDYFFDLSFALLFFALGQAVYEIGVTKAAYFLGITFFVGYAVEILGTSTGFPFGKYYYGNFLGEMAFGVPIVVPFVWFVIAYLTFSMTFGKYGKIDRRSLALLLSLAAFGAVAWDLLVDPMFSTYGYWIWEISPSTPALSGVPLTNFIGWFVVAFLMLALFVKLSHKGVYSNPIRKRNTQDSIIVYILLMIDAAVANGTLSHYLVIAIGVFAMSSFVVVTFYLNKNKLANKDSTKLGGPHAD
ncbi:MAG: carotenoid biosynthesis protein [Nitrososphaerales archaeon]